MSAWTEMSVGELVLEKPSRSKVFEKVGLDYCCRGHQALLVLDLVMVILGPHIQVCPVLEIIDDPVRPREGQVGAGLGRLGAWGSGAFGHGAA